MNISKELLSEVLGFTVVERYIEDTVSFGLQIAYKGTEDEWTYINIYELAHKCKEKAYSLGFDIYSDLNGADVCHIGSNYSIAPFHHNVTEIEAIFKACEWILENK